MLLALDYFGVFVFALSGALAADQRRMDIFGFVVIAFLPAVGGGTVRDIVLGLPVFWVENSAYLWLILLAAISTFAMANQIRKANRWLLWADAIGLSIFAALGTAKAMSVTGDPVIAVSMGVATAVLGGIFRDIVCNEVPMVLQKDVYATAAFAGALAYVSLYTLAISPASTVWLAATICFLVRACAIRWGLSLPRRHS